MQADLYVATFHLPSNLLSDLQGIGKPALPDSTLWVPIGDVILSLLLLLYRFLFLLETAAIGEEPGKCFFLQTVWAHKPCNQYEGWGKGSRSHFVQTGRRDRASGTSMARAVPVGRSVWPQWGGAGDMWDSVLELSLLCLFANSLVVMSWVGFGLCAMWWKLFWLRAWPHIPFLGSESLTWEF